MDNLEDEILENIIMRVNNFPSCAVVCKKWERVISSPTFAPLHASLHKERTWFTIVSSPKKKSLFLHDTATSSVCFKEMIESAEVVTTQATIKGEGDTIVHLYGGCFEQTHKGIQQVEEDLLATSSGLILSKSALGRLTMTNIMTKKKKLLPSPVPFLASCHIALVGMAYLWLSRSYLVLLAYQEVEGGLMTHLFKSETGQWHRASSALITDSFIGGIDPSSQPDPWGIQVSLKDQFRLPRSCAWLDGCFYCVLDRVVCYFDVNSMAWCRLKHGQDVALPSEMAHFFCLWEKDGYIIVAGSAKDILARNVVRMWRLVPSMREPVTGGFRWENMVQVDLPFFEADDGLRMSGRLCGKQGFGRGDYLCLATIDKDEFEATTAECHVYYHVYNWAHSTLTKVANFPFSTFFHTGFPANLAIEPCPLTSP